MGQKGAKIDDIYYAKSDDMGLGGVKDGKNFADVFYVRALSRKLAVQSPNFKCHKSETNLKPWKIT